MIRLMVGVLRSRPLRMFANYLSYQDRVYATLDAMLVGGMSACCVCVCPVILNLLFPTEG
jgi:hypothetical protein